MQRLLVSGPALLHLANTKPVRALMAVFPDSVLSYFLLFLALQIAFVLLNGSLRYH